MADPETSVEQFSDLPQHLCVPETVFGDYVAGKRHHAAADCPYVEIVDRDHPAQRGDRGAGVGAMSMVASEPSRRQAGVAILLLLAAGFAPRSPAPLLTMVLGIALLSRASLAFGEQQAADRTRDDKARERLQDRPSDHPSAVAEPAAD